MNAIHATDAGPLLSVRGLHSHYGAVSALRDVDIEVRAGELVALVGANGAGKTTLLNTLSGVQPASAGSIHFDGVDISRLKAQKRVASGIAQVPEGRQIFGPMSVADNLALGAYTRGTGAAVDKDIAWVYELFPMLAEKRRQVAGMLSGGQQQMLAIGRALMARPRLLLLDEPSMGLAPLLIAEIFEIIRKLNADGITILLVEQNASAALAIADHGFVLETGEIKLTGTGKTLIDHPDVKRAYLGMADDAADTP
ncbi:ABC transporter ATP-binding protein [Salinisphaera aquimarina]|uniref:High-affinity branched-chain amino acid transport ATP-binding protein n=1 Tax=Salinisphaera aquimarina TaxID=2094031 RepID=A0ABV7ENN6_9GAMM